jgi:methyl-accepting chemotaxis protein
MKVKDMPLGMKLILMTGSFVLISSIGLSLIAYSTARTGLERNISGSLVSMATEGSRFVRSRMDTYIATIEGIASHPDIQSLEWERQQPLLGSAMTRLGYQGLGIAGPDGKAIFHDHSTAELGSPEYLQRAFGGQTYLSDVIIDQTTGQAYIMLAAPIQTGREVPAVLVARLDGAFLSRITDRIRYGETGYSYIINGEGSLIAHPESDFVLERRNFIAESEENGQYADIAAMMQSMTEGETGLANYRFDGDRLIFGYAPVQRTDWSIAVGANQREVYAEIRALQLQMLLFLAVALPVILLLTIAFARKLAKPIVHVKTILKDISEGEGDLTRRLPVESNDEIGRMSHYFNLTFEKICSLIELIQAQAKMLQNAGTDMSTSMSQTAAAVHQISTNIQGVKERIVNQAAGVEESNATMESISSTITMLNEHIEEQSAGIVESSASITQMIANIESVSTILKKNSSNVEELIKAADSGQEGISKVSADIRTIAQESEGLLQASSVIAGIAGQTNLLAMNAAIEAAHAGDAGRGFAVVADEIRKLAENSGSQAKSITKVLKALKGSIDTVSHNSDIALSQFENIVSMVKIVSEQESVINSAMQEQNSGSRQILEALTEITTITDTVKERSNEILLGSRDVLEEMNQLARVTQEISSTMNEMAHSTEDINKAVAHVDQKSDENKESIDTLSEEIGRFSVCRDEDE